jgi:hypothetical protein
MDYYNNDDIVSLDEIKEDTPLSDEYDDETTIITITSKTKEYKIKQKYLNVSKTIKSIIKTCHGSSIIPLGHINIDDDIIELVMEYMIKQKGRDCEFPRKPLRSKNLKDRMTDVNRDWLVNWIDKIDDNGNGRIKLYNLINAANCLDIQGLLHLACAKVASFVIDEPIENIPKIFGNDTDE